MYRYMYINKIITPPSVRERSIVISLPVCVSVHATHISETTRVILAVAQSSPPPCDTPLKLRPYGAIQICLLLFF